MSKPAISDNLAYPIKIGLIREIGEDLSAQGGGRRPMMLELNKNHKYIVAIDLNYATPVFVLGNLRGEIIREFDIRITRKADAASYISVIENGVSILMGSKDIKRDDLLGIAIAIPGAFDPEGNYCSENPRYTGIKWSSLNLSGALQDKFGVDVIMKNDAKAATLGEWTAGAGEGAGSMMYVNAGIGLGAGIVLGSALFEGTHFTAGSIYDHYTDMGRMLSGETLEDAICMKALVGRYLEGLPEAGRADLLDDEWKGFEALVRDYQAHDPFVRELVDDACNEICLIMLNCANMLDLDRIVLGGEYTVFGDSFTKGFVNDFLPRCRHAPEFRIAALGRYSGIHGLFYLAREKYFDGVCLRNNAEEG